MTSEQTQDEKKRSRRRRHSLTDEQMRNVYDEFYESFSSSETMRIYNELNDD